MGVNSNQHVVTSPGRKPGVNQRVTPIQSSIFGYRFRYHNYSPMIEFTPLSEETFSC